MEKETPKKTDESKRVGELLVMCNNGNKPNLKAREELQRLLIKNPELKKAIQRQQGMYYVALKTRIESMSSSDTMKEVMYVKCDQLREELGYNSANQLEKLAIEQIVICWINYYETEIRHANVLSQLSFSRETGIYWEKRLTFSSRRYTRALELLSKMRKMKLVVQVNNAENQIIRNSI